MQLLLSPYYMFFLSLLIPFASFAKPFDSPADFRLIITGGIKGVHGGDRAFYKSSLFRLNDAVDGDFGPFVIEDASFKAFRLNDVVYFSFEKIDKSDLLQSEMLQKSHVKKGTAQGLQGAQAFGFAFNNQGTIEKLDNQFLRRELGSIYGQFNWEVRQVGETRIFAIDVSGGKKEIQWPKSIAEIDDTEAVIGLYPQVNKKTIFFPRQLAATSRVFGVVDHLLAQRSEVPTRYLDIGNALFNSDDESLAMAKQTHALLMARNPVVLGAGRYDLNALFQDKALLEKSPYVLALQGVPDAPQSRIANVGKVKVQFSALGDMDSLALGFLPKGVLPLTIQQSIQKSGASASKADLVIGLSDNSNSAGVATSSPVFDAVLSLVSDIKGALPAQDDIDLERNHQEGLNSVAPLVRVSASDVTEVLVWSDQKGYINRLEIHRYPVVDSGPEATDVEEIFKKNIIHSTSLDLGLPEKELNGTKQAWVQSDFDDVLGGILLQAQPNTELAILDLTEAATPTYSAVPKNLAQSLLERPGRAIWLSLQGKYIKRILKAAQKKQFGLPIILVGGDAKKGMIGRREINDAESYRVVVTEKVLIAIDDFMKREGLSARSTLAASSLQTSLFEGSRDSLKILSELRKRDESDDASIGEKRDLLDASSSISQIVHSALAAGITKKETSQLVQNSLGSKRHTLVFDVTDLDFGLKANHTNNELSQWQNHHQTSKTAFTEARFWDQNYLNILIYAKAALKYYGPLVDAELAFSEKFFQPNSENSDDIKKLNFGKLRPVKDTTKINAEVRLPFSRVMERPFLPALGLGALANLTYETQLWPNILMSTIDPKDWPRRISDTRLFLGLGAKPKTILENLQAGAVLGYDFSRDSAMQSLAAGFEIGAAGKWNVGKLVFKLESSLRKMFPFVAVPDQGRMGMIWLTDSKVEVPIYGGFSLSAILNFTVGAQMNNPWVLGTNTLFGLALSYGGNFKWLL